MGVQEIRDDFLISMGCSITNKYNYIDSEYDYFEKLEEQEVKINNKLIPVRRIMANTTMLNSDLSVSGTQAMLKVAEKINSIQGHNNDTIAQLGNYTMEVGKLYFVDWLKYSINKLKIDEQLLQYLISLVTSASATLNDNVMGILNKYQINLSNAKMEAMNWQTQRNAEITAQNANAPKTIFATTYTRDAIIGNGQVGYTFATAKSTVTDGMLRGQFQSSSLVADIISKNKENSAYQKATGELGQTIENIILRFNEQLMELLVMKLPNLFSEDILNNDRNLELNPTNVDEWIKIIPELNDDELNNLKKLNKFYGIGLTSALERNLLNDMYNYYIKESKTDFSNSYLKLYSIIKEKETKAFPALSAKISKYFDDKIERKNSWETTKNSNVASKLWDDNKKAIKECEYLIEEDKERLIKKCDFLTKEWVNRHSRETKTIKLYALLTVIGLILSPIIILNFGAFWNLISHTKSGVIAILGFLACLVFGAIIIGTLGCICLLFVTIKDYLEFKR